jgi:aryl-alcohol dehydrogenase-like predicted oxidoreductase
VIVTTSDVGQAEEKSACPCTLRWHELIGLAEAKGVAPAQIALAWVYAQQARLGVPVVPIPGTKRVKWLRQNIAVLGLTLTEDELALLAPLGGKVSGARY